VPTFKENGFDLVAPTWFALFAPAGTPREAISRFEAELMAATRVPEIRAKIEALGFQPVGSTADELARAQRQEFARWAEVVKSSGFKPD
jgi:tripartite-type tricarboxylate transporter receptor subunit TctC